MPTSDNMSKRRSDFSETIWLMRNYIFLQSKDDSYQQILISPILGIGAFTPKVLITNNLTISFNHLKPSSFQSQLLLKKYFQTNKLSLGLACIC